MLTESGFGREKEAIHPRQQSSVMFSQHVDVLTYVNVISGSTLHEKYGEERP